MLHMIRGCSRVQKLAFQYLEELASEFSRLYGTQVDSVARPYAFIKFGEPVSVTGCWVTRRLALLQLPGHHWVLPRVGAPPMDVVAAGA